MSKTARSTRSVSGRFPLDTPITAMLSPEEAERLTPRARDLNKADLIALWRGEPTDDTRGLTTSDINSIRAAFSDQIATGAPVGLAAGDVNCCCSCCPCCCAEASIEARVA